MKRLAYFLMGLLISAQVDDAWAITQGLSNVLLTDSDDEFLPSHLRSVEAESTSHERPLLLDLKCLSTGIFSTHKTAFSPRILTWFLAPSLLYFFMSLQI